MRILLYTRAFPPATGGMERFAEDLATWLAGHDHIVTVVTMTVTEAEDRVLDGKRDFRILRVPGPIDFRTALRSAEVVHVSGCSVKGLGAALSARKLPVLTHHGFQAICPVGEAGFESADCPAGPVPGPCSLCRVRGPRGRATVAIHHGATRYAATNVSVSRYLSDRLRLTRPRVIYNPLAERSFRSETTVPGEAGLIAFAGRLVEGKGLEVLLRALATVPDARLEVAGDGPMRPEWESLTDELGLEQRVDFLGQLPFSGIVELYGRSAVVCVPSTRGEAFGYACAEAMAMGRPVVAMPRGALSELLEHDRGWLAAGSSPEELASVLTEALASSEQQISRGSRARAFAKATLAMDVIGPMYLRAYEGAAWRTG